MQAPIAQRIGMPGSRANPIAPQPPNPMGPPQGQPPTQTTPNLYRPGGPINQPPISQMDQAVTPSPQGPTVFNTGPGQQGVGQPPQGIPQGMALGGVAGAQRPQVRRPMFGQYPHI